MRSITVAIAILVALIALPFSSSANAEVTKKVIIKRGHGDRGWHRGWARALRQQGCHHQKA
jgi:hypothetical protein